MVGRKRRKSGISRRSKKTRNGRTLISRSRALRRLQVGLQDFRRLCILKGVYPRPSKDSGWWFHLKDVAHLERDPLLEKLREHHAFMRHVARAKHRGDLMRARYLAHHAPVLPIPLVLKTRFPTLMHAIRDLDDAICTLAVFSVMSANDAISLSGKQIQKATMTLDYFLAYLCETRSIRKSFISIKGYYFQAEIMGEEVTFMLPHAFAQTIPKNVDFTVLNTFMEIYLPMVQFITFKLYSLQNLRYPPHICKNLFREGGRFLSMRCRPHNLKDTYIKSETKEAPEISNDSVNHSTEIVENNFNGVENTNNNQQLSNFTEQYQDFRNDKEFQQILEKHEEIERIKHLFDGLVFFISREVPLIPISIVIKSCGGMVLMPLCMKRLNNASSITHYVVDRPLEYAEHEFNSKRDFVQPQWIFDCLNCGVKLPIEHYMPGKILPPHLSPFVIDSDVGYIPEQREILNGIIRDIKAQQGLLRNLNIRRRTDKCDKNDQSSESDDDNLLTSNSQAKKVIKINSSKEKDDKKELERRKMMLSKKHRRLLERIEHTKKKKTAEVKNLIRKRHKLQNSRNV